MSGQIFNVLLVNHNINQFVTYKLLKRSENNTYEF